MVVSEQEYAAQMMMIKTIRDKLKLSKDFTEAEKLLIQGYLIDKFIDGIEEGE